MLDRPRGATVASVTETVAVGESAYTQTMPRRRESARTARLLVSSALRVWGLEGATDAARLVVSELVANAFVHASGPQVRVTVTRRGETLVRVAVIDDSPALPESRPVSDRAESGRGLTLVAAHCHGRWGVDVLDRGKSVWADVPVPADCPTEPQ